MNRVFLVLTGFLLTGHAQATASAPKTPKDTVEAFVSAALATAQLPKERLLRGTGPVRGFCDLIQEAFDLEEAAPALVSKDVWDQATADQQKDYMRAVWTHFAIISATSFLQYGGKIPSVQCRDVEPINNLPSVAVEISAMKLDEVVLVRRMSDETFRLHDIYSDGISMRSNKRSDWARMAKKGLPVLTDALNKVPAVRTMGTCGEKRIADHIQSAAAILSNATEVKWP